MTEMTREQQAPAMGDGEPSTTAQAKEKVQETAGQAQEQAGQKVKEVRGQAGETVRRQLDTRSTQAGEQVSATADAMRKVGQQLRQDGKETPARFADQAAEPVERLGRYLTEADGQRILRDAEQLARRRPWVTAIGGATVGFLIARFLKASSAGSGQTPRRTIEGQRALPQGHAGVSGGGYGHPRE
jgi:ElaB/YqjD/DUF883 family membrane-anchored ribosome-binding protein